jgi:hypothetical protein
MRSDSRNPSSMNWTDLALSTGERSIPSSGSLPSHGISLIARICWLAKFNFDADFGTAPTILRLFKVPPHRWGVYRNVPKVAVSCAYLLESASQSGNYLFAKNQRFDGSRNPIKSGTWRSIPYHLAR